ncbi:MAG: hypothetical protein U9N09_07775, partial [Euryarchaeota archaeon]|nr:hypothetical protein [Euryarchaeota archaeon]
GGAIIFAAADRDLQRDCGICEGDLVVAVEIAILRRSPWLHEWEVVHATAAAWDWVTDLELFY